MRIAAAKDGSLLATRTQKVDSHLAVVTGAVVLAHEDVHKRREAFVEMVGKGKCLFVCLDVVRGTFGWWLVRLAEGTGCDGRLALLRAFCLLSLC